MGSPAVAEGRDEKARRLPFGQMVDVEDADQNKVWKMHVQKQTRRLDRTGCERDGHHDGGDEASSAQTAERRSTPENAL